MRIALNLSVASRNFSTGHCYCRAMRCRKKHPDLRRSSLGVSRRRKCGTPDAQKPPQLCGAAAKSSESEVQDRQTRPLTWPVPFTATREASGKLGGIAIAFTRERRSTRVRAMGAEGERRMGARLDAIAGDEIRVLHDRRIPRSKANIDHIVVTSAAVWVIDTKRYVEKRVEKRVEGGIFSPRVEKKLWVRGDKTSLVTGMHKQVERVSSTVRGVPVKGVLCFVNGDWPLFADPLNVDGVLVLWPKKLVQMVAKEQPGGLDVAAVHRALAGTFRASSAATYSAASRSTCRAMRVARAASLGAVVKSNSTE